MGVEVWIGIVGLGLGLLVQTIRVGVLVGKIDQTGRDVEGLKARIERMPALETKVDGVVADFVRFDERARSDFKELRGKIEGKP
jgi:hypothetical protein